MNTFPLNKKIVLLITILLLLSSNLSIISLANTYQDIVTVDINGDGDFLSIKEAIENVEPLTIIKINPGTYLENNIVIDKKITIIGESSDEVIIDLQNRDGFRIESSYVEISNIKIINSNEHAIFAPFTYDSCNFSNIVIDNVEQHGIILQGSYTTLYNCNIGTRDSDGEAIKIRGSNNVIRNCKTTGFKTGVLVLINANKNIISKSDIINCDVGIDIRINSDENIVTNCNIYGNRKGIVIWQDSTQNTIYNNNFWKNNIDAEDEDNNIWHSDGVGNYWDDYTGIDSDGDGIGDQPYVISDNVVDEYPLIDMILPEEITVPTNLRKTTPDWDKTPTFTWNPSVYSKGVKGYHVRIDDNKEISIGDITTWTLDDKLGNGVHTFYVKAEGSDGSFSDYVSIIFSIDSTFVDSDSDGWSDSDEQKYGTDPFDENNYPLDTDGDKIPDVDDLDDDNDGYNDQIEISYGTSTTDPTKHPVDTDGDMIPDESSSDGKYVGDVDDDDDYLKDDIEKRLGSDPKKNDDVEKIYIQAEPYFLVDTTQNNEFNILYNEVDDKTTNVQINDEGLYLIDINGDNRWEYVYGPSDGSIEEYSYHFSISFEIILLFIISIFIGLLFVFRRKIIGKINIKEEPDEKILEDKNEFIAGDLDTIEMVSQTKTLLESIQKDVKSYMTKLDDIEKQISKGKTYDLKIEQPKEEIIDVTTKKQEYEKTDEFDEIQHKIIERKVDELISRKEDEKE